MEYSYRTFGKSLTTFLAGVVVSGFSFLGYNYFENKTLKPRFFAPAYDLDGDGNKEYVIMDSKGNAYVFSDKSVFKTKEEKNKYEKAVDEFLQRLNNLPKGKFDRLEDIFVFNRFRQQMKPIEEKKE